MAVNRPSPGPLKVRLASFGSEEAVMEVLGEKKYAGVSDVKRR
jgi:hypothetical protein